MLKSELRIFKKDKAIDYLGGCCWKCEGTFDRELYDFHHIVPSSKKYVWHTLRDMSWNSIRKELDVCVLLCANCHRTAHKEMLNANI
jgi:5-methylcytosine-specific restriction endonuclease McrA